jgi:hypothetical protein
MAKIGVKIEATEEGTEQRSEFPPLPDGVYRLELDSGDVKESDEGTTNHKIGVNMTARVIEPEEYADRKLFLNYNVQHPNPQAQEIGEKQFQCLLRSMGMTEVEDDDTDNLLFHSFVATIGMGKDSKEKNSDGSPKYKARNVISRYWFPDKGDAPEIGITGPVAANDNKRPAAAAAPVKEPTKAATGSKPWGARAK